MDRISALRNVEEALADYEAGEASLADLERRVRTVLRTYATEFDAGEDLAAYRATGDPPAAGLVVVADSPAAARERVRRLVESDAALEDDADRDDGNAGRADGNAGRDDGDDLAHDDYNAGHDNADPDRVDHEDDLDFDVTPVDRQR